MAIGNYQELDVWHLARELNRQVYQITKRLPPSETKNLIDQLQRASTSIPSNISEGSTRSTLKDFIRFLNYARASGEEVYVQLTLCLDVGYFQLWEINTTLILCERVNQMLDKFIESLKRRQKWEKEEARKEKERKKDKK